MAVILFVIIVLQLNQSFSDGFELSYRDPLPQLVFTLLKYMNDQTLIRRSWQSLFAEVQLCQGLHVIDEV